MSGDASILVFLGPSLAHAEAAELLTARYAPPARHGDIYRALNAGIDTIVLLDGVFHFTPSVWQREVLAAVDEGVRVIGAASMGALRAAELHTLGVEGCGTVFAWFRDGVIDGDDEVALAHAGAEHGFRPLSEPLVNIRATLEHAQAQGRITAAQADTMLAHAKATYFPERSFAAAAEAPALGLSQAERLELARWLKTNAIDIKAADARSALARAAARQPRPAPRLTRDDSLWHAARVLEAGLGRTAQVRGREVLQAVLADPYRWPQLAAPAGAHPVATLRQLVTRRFCLLDWAERRGLRAPAPELTPHAHAWRERYGEPTRAWLIANGLTQAAYAIELEMRAFCAWLEAQAPERFGLHARAGEERSATYVRAWGEELGLRWPAEALCERAPAALGYTWDLDAAIVRELQMRGVAAAVADALGGT